MARLSVDRFVALNCRQSYYQFLLEFWPVVSAEKLVPNWHIQKLCEELQSLSERVFLDKAKEYDLIWNQPPGTTKSKCVSVLWQPWVWTRMPSARFITGSYAERLSLDFARQSRDIVRSEKYQSLFPEVVLREDQNTKSFFMNKQGGWRFSTGVGGSAIGMHAHFVAIDDPIDPIGAMSDLVINEANIWIAETLSDRKVDKQVVPIVLIQHRLHQNDPAGNWLERGGRIKHVCLPADTSWPIKPAEWRSFYREGLLDPVRLPRSVLEEAGKRGEAYYAGQYGQCLVAGTMVETSQGSKAIEDILPGDCVATRDGYKTVKWSGQTKTIHELTSVLFNNGSILSGTADHPIWEERLGIWACLESLSGTDYNRVYLPCLQGAYLPCLQGTHCCVPHSGDSPLWADQDYQLRKLLFLEDENIFVAKVANTSKEDGWIKRNKSTIATYTGMSGDFTVVTSPKALSFTTRTGIQVTTRLRILNAFLIESMASGTVPNCELQNIANFLTKSVFLAMPGISHLRGELITEKMARQLSKGFGRRRPIEITFVLSVKDTSSPEEQVLESGTALTGVRTGSERFDVITKSAPGVESHLRLATQRPNAVQRRVRPDKDGIPVYDLSIDGAHEFYANGILVHNSPVPRGGAMFKVDRLIKDARVPDKWKRPPVRYWDKATTLQGGDYTAGVKMAVDLEGRFWILDVVRGQWNSGQREQRIIETARTDGKAVRIGIEQEPGSGGKESAESSAKRYSLLGFRVSIDPARGSKEIRADTFSVQVNVGNVIIAPGPWNHAFVEEMRFFPLSTYDDQIDAASGAFAMLAKARIRIGVLQA